MFQYNEPNLNFYLLSVKTWNIYGKYEKKNDNGSYFHDRPYFYLQDVYMWINIIPINTHWSNILVLLYALHVLQHV